MADTAQDMALPAARAGRASPEPASSLGHTATIANAWRRFATWLGPFGTALAGIFLLMVGASSGDDHPNIVLCLIGGLTILSAFEQYAARARGKEQERWASLLASLFDGQHGERRGVDITYTVNSIRPELDKVVAEQVAQAIEARRAATTGAVEDESAVATPCAPTPAPKDNLP